MNKHRRLKYYQGALQFWLGASELQLSRCLAPSCGSDAARADINFYVVAVQRVREVARLCKDKAGLDDAAVLLQEFDKQWPRFKELRHQQEHIKDLSDEPPYGIWYFKDVVAELGIGGDVNYLVRVDEMQVSVRALANGLEALIARELEK